jgi:hypothetical protein
MPRPWVPTIDYELVASHMPPEAREAYIDKSRAWFDAHPPRAWPEPAPRSQVDPEDVVRLIAKYGSRVPIEEYRKIGYSEESLKRIEARRLWCKEHQDELQAEIDRRWPGSAKAPKKVIKAVKKKIV